MMKRIHSHTIMFQLAFLFFCLYGLCAAHAEEQLLFTSGTTIQHNGTNYAYLVWQANNEALLTDQSFAIFRKDGGPDSLSPFSLTGMATLQTDPASIQLLLERAAALGEDDLILESTIDQLFGQFVPSDALPLRDKISAVIRGSVNDVTLFDNLLFLSKLYPTIATAIGRAFTCSIPAGISTFEIRHYNLYTGSADEIIGRVTLDSANPVVLPAPDALREVDDDSPKGHLNVRLRWDTPDDLLRLSMLSFGFNVYRISEYSALKYGYNITPPTPDQLENDLFSQVNDVPILADEDEIGTDGWFLVDDNDQFAPGGAPFGNGDVFYYFVTARDLLGRNGLCSTGLAVTICDRFPPRIPRHIDVASVYAYSNSTGQVGFKITWDQNPDGPDDVTTGYYVYRSDSITNLQALAGDVMANRISSLIPFDTAVDCVSFVDTNFTGADVYDTVWYTVRAVDNSACKPNFSGQGAPAFGAYHNFVSPDNITNVTATFMTEDAETVFVSDDVDASPPRTEQDTFKLICALPSLPTGVAWTEFAYNPGSSSDPSTAIPLGNRLFFKPGQTARTMLLKRNEQATFFCRVGSKNGAVSPWAHHVAEQVQKGTCRTIRFEAGTRTVTRTIDDGGTLIIPDDVPNDWQWPIFRIPFQLGIAEYRLYRSVDSGMHDLISDGLFGTNESYVALVEDLSAGVAYGATLCYYLQCLDKDGNPSSYDRLLCLTVQPAEPPTPMLMSLDPHGDSSTPEMRAEWFCAPDNVERFHIWLSADGLAPETEALQYCTRLDTTNEYEVTLPDGSTETMLFAVYQTGRVGANFGSATNPLFTADASITLGRTYTMFVRAIGAGDAQSDDSEVLQFAWHIPPSDTPEVPWPVRNVSAVQTNTYSEFFQAEFLDAATSVYIPEDRVGIRIGSTTYSVEGKPPAPVTIYNNADPMTYVFTNAADPGSTMFPFALYRYQLTNDLFPAVSGDVYQVSPLMEEIAYLPDGTNTLMYDPYILFVPDPIYDNVANMFMLDSQPTVRGATYQYLLMRFDENHEIERIIPANPIEVPAE